EDLLAGVEATLRRHLPIVIRGVSPGFLQPFAIDRRDTHVTPPHLVHPEHCDKKCHACKRMPEARRWPAAQHRRHPVQVRGVKGKAGREAIAVRKSIHPVANALAEAVTSHRFTVGRAVAAAHCLSRHASAQTSDSESPRSECRRSSPRCPPTSAV